MSVSAATIRWTYKDYCAIPEDLLRHEILDGDHVVTPAPSIRHQRIVLELAFALRSHLKRSGIGEVFVSPVDVRLDTHTVVQPDLTVVLERSRATLTEAGIQGPPDLMIEILSPSTRARDEDIKHRLYERSGVRSYWRVDLDRDEIVVNDKDGERFGPAKIWGQEQMLTSALLPGFELALHELFV